MTVPIGGLMKFSTIDFPGVLSCVLFLRGCDLDCFYCHNRGLLGPGEDLPWSQVQDFLRRRAGMLDGVVVSGGEPTLHPGLPELLAELKGLGYKVKLDTNGRRTALVQDFVKQGLVDYVAVDWKAPQGQYPSVCGGDPTGRERTKATIDWLWESGAPFEVRTTLYPGLSSQDLLELAGELPPVPLYRINYYRQPKEYKPEDEGRIKAKALSPQEVKLLRAGLAAAQPNIVLE